MSPDERLKFAKRMAREKLRRRRKKTNRERYQRRYARIAKERS